MTGWRPVWAGLLVALLLLSGCELLEDGPAAPRAGAQLPTAARTAAPPAPRATQARELFTPTAPATPGRDSPTPGTPTATPTLTVTPTRPPVALTPRPAASGYRRYTSTLYPYAIDYLESWRAVGAGAQFDGGQADLFAGERRGAIVNTVTVLSQPIVAGTSLQLFLETSMADLGEAGIQAGDEIERTIDGHDAYVFSYTLTRDDRTYAITQAIFVRQNHAWVLTLTAAPEDNDRLVPVFTHMLDSFQAL
jgi:hypothetical protein